MKRGAKRPYYDADQIKEVLRLTDGLREANQAGVRELQRWRRSWISEERRKKTCELIKLVAFQIHSLVKTLEQLRDEAQEQSPSLILITFSLLCDECSPSEGSAQNKDADIDAEAKELELLHQSLWPTLQELSDAVHERQKQLFQSFISGQTRSRSFYAALMQLQDAVRRQRRYLRKFVPVQVPEIRVEEDDTKCVCCDKTQAEMEEQVGSTGNGLDADFQKL